MAELITDHAARLASELVRHDTVEGNEAVLADLLQPRLRTAGLTVHRHELAPGRAGLVALSSAPARTVFTGHLDTVPAGPDRWSWDPWSGELVGGLLRGRGSSDMKGGVAAIVSAVEALAADGMLPDGVGVVLTAGEETGSAGARAMATADALAPLRGGGSPPGLVVAEPTDLVLARGHRGVVWAEVVTEGVAVPASQPQVGRNAIVPLARGVASLPVVDAALDHPVYGPTTFNVGTFHGGHRRNTVADHAAVSLDVRTVPGVTAADVRRRLAEVFGPDADVTITLALEPVLTEADHSLIMHAAQLVGEPPGGLETAVRTFATDASVLAPALGGASVLLLGPGLPDRVHAADEVCPASQIRRAAQIYARLAADGIG